MLACPAYASGGALRISTVPRRFAPASQVAVRVSAYRRAHLPFAVRDLRPTVFVRRSAGTMRVIRSSADRGLVNGSTSGLRSCVRSASPAARGSGRSDPASDFDPLAGFRAGALKIRTCTRRFSAAGPSAPGALFTRPYPLLGFRRLPMQTCRSSPAHIHFARSCVRGQAIFCLPPHASGLAGPSASS